MIYILLKNVPNFDKFKVKFKILLIRSNFKI